MAFHKNKDEETKFVIKLDRNYNRLKQRFSPSKSSRSGRKGNKVSLQIRIEYETKFQKQEAKISKL